MKQTEWTFKIPETLKTRIKDKGYKLSITYTYDNISKGIVIDVYVNDPSKHLSGMWHSFSESSFEDWFADNF